MMSLTMLALATATTPRAPSGKWVVDYQSRNCVASRAFGVSPGEIGLALRPMFSVNANNRTMLILGPAKGKSDPIVGKAKLTLMPSGRQTQVSLFSWVTGKQRVYELGLSDDATLSEATRSTSIVVAAGQEVFSFATGDLAPVFGALKDCTDKLLASWGVDPSTLVKERPEEQN